MLRYESYYEHSAHRLLEVQEVAIEKYPSTCRTEIAGAKVKSKEKMKSEEHYLQRGSTSTVRASIDYYIRRRVNYGGHCHCVRYCHAFLKKVSFNTVLYSSTRGYDDIWSPKHTSSMKNIRIESAETYIQTLKITPKVFLCFMTKSTYSRFLGSSSGASDSKKFRKGRKGRCSSPTINI